MADPKRLGKRGAYRLGELRAPERVRRRPVPHEPTFTPRRSRAWVLAWLAACAGTAALLALGARYGLWFLPFVAGIAAGAGPWRAGPALGLAVLAVAAGWGAALWWPARSGAPIGATARVVAALAGLPPYAAVGVAGTLLVGIGQVVAAFWLARAVTYGLRQRTAVLTSGWPAAFQAVQEINETGSRSSAVLLPPGTRPSGGPQDPVALCQRRARRTPVPPGPARTGHPGVRHLAPASIRSPSAATCAASSGAG